MFWTSHCLKLHRVYDLGSSRINFVTSLTSLTSSYACFFRSLVLILMALSRSYLRKLKMVGMSEHSCMRRAVNSMYLGTSSSAKGLFLMWKKSASLEFILLESSSSYLSYCSVLTCFCFLVPWIIEGEL